MKQCGAKKGKEELERESELVGNCGSLARTLLRVLRERKKGRQQLICFFVRGVKFVFNVVSIR
jgi:hypothetical protein